VCVCVCVCVGLILGIVCTWDWYSGHCVYVCVCGTDTWRVCVWNWYCGQCMDIA